MTANELDHYCDLDIDCGEVGLSTVETEAFVRHAMATLWRTVHACACARRDEGADAKYAVDFPQWVAPVLSAQGDVVLKGGSFGARLRVFSSVEFLESLPRAPGLRKLYRTGLLMVGTVLPVPAGTQFVRVSRNRSRERASGAWAAARNRQDLGRIARGKRGPSQPALPRVPQSRELLANFLMTTSKANGNPFKLLVNREPVDKIEASGRLSTWGLGAVVPRF